MAEILSNGQNLFVFKGPLHYLLASFLDPSECWPLPSFCSKQLCPHLQFFFNINFVIKVKCAYQNVLFGTSVQNDKLSQSE